MNSYKIKSRLADILANTLPLTGIMRKFKNRYILAYHRVVPAEYASKYCMQDSMWISPETFEEDIKWLNNLGDIVDLDTILNFDIPNKTPLFCITFDDGWIDNYEHAYPILKKHGVPATIFLVTSAVDTGNLFWVEDFLYKIVQVTNDGRKGELSNIVSELINRTGTDVPQTVSTKNLAEHLMESIKPLNKKEREAVLSDLYESLSLSTEPLLNHLMNWQQVKEMNRDNITFGSHTHTHEILKYIDDDDIRYELNTSRDLLVSVLNKPVKYFCYPNARYRDDNADIIKESGYEYAFRIHNLALTKDVNNYFVPRFIMNEMTCRNKNNLLCRLLNIPKY